VAGDSTRFGRKLAYVGRFKERLKDAVVQLYITRYSRVPNRQCVVMPSWDTT
jgi:hypothetical protein